MGIQWDQANEEHLLEDHGVTPEEAEDIFYNDPLRLGQETVKGESRHKIVGVTHSGRILAVVWTTRRNRVRVVTAFDASIKDIKRYLSFAKRRKP